MENKYLSEEGAMLQNKIRSVIKKIGGGIAGLTFIIGLFFMFNLSLIIGLLVVAGIVPIEILLTYLATQCISVETEYVECGYTKITESNLTLIKSDDKGKEETKEVEFTKIEPVRHFEIVNSDNRNYSRSRIR